MITTLLPSTVTVVLYTTKAALTGTRCDSKLSTMIGIVLQPTSPPATSPVTLWQFLRSRRVMQQC
jgi:hypothetical protein